MSLISEHEINKKFSWLAEQIRCIKASCVSSGQNVELFEIQLPEVEEDASNPLVVIAGLINSLPNTLIQTNQIPLFKTKVFDTYYTIGLNKKPIDTSVGLNSEISILSSELIVVSYEKEEGVYINTDLSPLTLGGYIEGEPITPLEGLTQSQFNDKFFTNITLPTISFNINSQIIEKGADFAQTINIVFAPNDAEATGATFSLEKDEVEVSATQSTEFEAINVVSNFTLQGFVSYAANSVLSSGIISTPLRTITQRLKFWYGALSAIPTNSTQVRAIANDVWDNVNTITLETGTTEKIFVVARPTSGGTQASLPAQDITNNVSYTYDFESTIDVVLPNTTTEEYRIYVLEVDNAYTTNAQHLIQI